MLILLIIFAIMLIATRLYTNYLRNNMKARVNYQLNGSIFLGLLMIGQYIIGAIIIIKIILKFMN